MSQEDQSQETEFRKVEDCTEAEPSGDVSSVKEEAAKDEPLSESTGNEEKEAAPAPKEPTLEEQLAAMRDNYLRALAENENYRKRVSREMQDIRENTRMNTIGEIVGVYDLLQMAVKASESAQDMKTLQQGLSMTFGQFKHTLKNLGVEVVDACGAKFDPQLHEAVSMVPSDEVAEGDVVQQWQVGFKLGGKLLRPAKVIVSSGPAVKAEPEAEKTSEV